MVHRKNDRFNLLKTIRRIFRIAVPNSIENGLFQISKVALSSIVAMFGTVQIAANGVAQSFWSMAALFCLAMGPAFITVVGQYMGAGDSEGAEYYMKKLLVLHNIFNALFCPVAFSVSNGMRAAGDVKFTMFASIFSTVVCRVVLSVLFGVVWNLGVIGITLAMVADWGIHAALVIWRYRSEKWKTFEVI